MKKKKTKVAFEYHLNELYSDSYSEEQAVENLIYLTNKNRTGGTTTEKNIRSAHTNHTLGAVLRRYDPVAFNVAYNDWNP